jgi:hypothetical protein
MEPGEWMCSGEVLDSVTVLDEARCLSGCPCDLGWSLSSSPRWLALWPWNHWGLRSHIKSFAHEHHFSIFSFPFSSAQMRDLCIWSLRTFSDLISLGFQVRAHIVKSQFQSNCGIPAQGCLPRLSILYRWPQAWGSCRGDSNTALVLVTLFTCVFGTWWSPCLGGFSPPG